MRDRLPSLNALRAFEAAARHGSFTHAARELSVTQGAVSQQIRRLEDELGYPLFHRGARRVRLTEQGEVLAAAATEALSLVVDAVRRNRRHLGTGLLTVSVPASFAVKWFVPRLDLFSQLHPDIEVRIAATNRLVAPGREGIDLCVRFGPGDYAGYDCELLVTEDVFPVCSPHLVDGALTAEALTAYPLLHDEVLAEHPQRMSWQRYLAEVGVYTDASGGPHFSHSAMAISAAIAGQGIALARTCLVADDLAAGRLVRPGGSAVPSPFSYWLLAPPGGLQRRHVAAMVAWMRSSIEGGAQAGR